MLLFSIIVILIVLKVFLFYKRQSLYGADHYYHLSLINAIKANRSRFIKKHPNILDDINFCYCQFYHWLLSCFNKAVYEKNTVLLAFCIDISAFVFSGFILFYTGVGSVGAVSFLLFFFSLYFSSPFLYNKWNAKNYGLTARGLGVVFGCIYVCLVYGYLTGHTELIYLIAITQFLIILSSLFAIQMVVLTLPLLLIFFQSWLLLVTFILANLLYLVLFREVAVLFYKGNINYKIVYYTFLSKINLFVHRKSVYGDWVKIFPFLLYAYFRSFKIRRTALQYVKRNSIVNFLFSFGPFYFFLFLRCDYESVLFKLCLIPLILVFIISFNKFRFLGEPERYTEFFVPLLALSAILFCSVNEVLIIAVVNMGLTLLQDKIEMEDSSASFNDILDKLSDFIKKTKLETPGERYIFSNSIYYTLSGFMSGDKILRFEPSDTQIAGIAYKDLYRDVFPQINPVHMPAIMKAFNIDTYIHDSALPNATECYEIISGLPEFKEYKISDSIFVYIK